MEGKVLSGLMLALLLVAAFMSPFENLRVGAEPRTIVVPDDYRTIQEAINAASPGDAVFVRAGTYSESVVVNKTVSLVGESRDATTIEAGWENSGFRVVADNVCVRGFTISRSDGILVDGSFNSSISGNNIEGEVAYGDFDVIFQGNGIHLHNSSHCSVSENTINSTQIAIYSYYSANCSISGNKVIHNEYGILVEGSSNTSLLNNTAYDNSYGIAFGRLDNVCPPSSRNSVLRNNKMTNNKYNFGIGGFTHREGLDAFIHDIDSSNTVNGKPFCYWVNQQNKVVPSDAGYVAIINSTNMTVRNLTLTGNVHGVLFAFTTNSTIQNVTATENFMGIYLFASPDNYISDNNIRESGIGIELYVSSNCSVIDNNIRDSRSGDLWMGIGIELNGSHNCSIIGNSIKNTHTSYGFYSSPSPFPGTGIMLLGSDNVIYHNNFVDNEQQAYGCPGSPNFLDYGYPTGGNYWSDYNGVDWYKGPYQNETGSDGIGDSPYVISGDNIDRYPLMKPYPWNSHDIAITRAGSKTVVGQGFDPPINVTIFNYGTSTETFNVSAHINASLLQTRTVTIPSRDSTTITFTWNTTNVAKGRYTITVEATQVLGEIDTTDNALTQSVMVAMIGDITGPDGYPDGRVDIRDIYTVAKAFGSYPGHRYWDSNADINDDDKVNINDLFIMAKQFGQADP